MARIIPSSIADGLSFPPQLVDSDVAQPAALFRWLGLLHLHAEDLIVIGNDRRKCPLRLRSAGSALQGVQDVLESIIQVVRSKFRVGHIQPNRNPEMIGCAVNDSAFSPSRQGCSIDLATPTVSRRYVTGEPELQFLGVFRHDISGAALLPYAAS